MKQILHIWAKDALHLWHEILLSLALTATFVFTCPSRWEGGSPLFGPRAFDLRTFGTHGGASYLLSEVLTVLIPLSWWLLISSAIHSERLVGDSQFWLTRPYEWKRLLSAKVFFMMSFIYLPMLATQSILLLRAGFQPLSCLPDLLINLLQLTGLLILPLFALATVTKDFGRMTLTVLGFIVCLMGIWALSSTLQVGSISSPYGDLISVATLIFGCSLVVVLQYATRNLRFAWPVLVALFVAVEGIAIAAPDQVLMNRSFPKAPDNSPVALDFEYPRGGGFSPSTFVGPRSNEVGIDIPVHVAGVPEGTVSIPDDLRISIEAADGSGWTSVWQPINMDIFLPEGKFARASFTMPRIVYEKYKSRPLSVRVTFAITQAQVDRVVRIPLPMQSFQIPGFGTCLPETGYAEQPDAISGIVCRAPMKQPDLTLIHVLWFDGACHRRMELDDKGIQGAAWAGSLNQETMDLRISPVWASQIQFSNSSLGYRSDESRHLCPGTTTTFTEYKLERRTQASFTIQNFELPALSQVQAAVMDSH